MIDNTLFWKGHIYKIVPRMSLACYIMTVSKPFFFLQDILKMIYYAYFHSGITYGLLFWGNSSHSMNILDYKRKLLELRWEPEAEIPAQIFLNFRNITFRGLCIHIL
jgi:hypothetical protein